MDPAVEPQGGAGDGVYAELRGRMLREGQRPICTGVERGAWCISLTLHAPYGADAPCTLRLLLDTRFRIAGNSANRRTDRESA